jgi:hypothetical protein
MIARLLRRLLGWDRTAKPRELVTVSYHEADVLIRRNEGWRLAPEEDDNPPGSGFVYLERDQR